MSSASIRKEMDAFLELARFLSSSIAGASVDWQDDVYSNLQTRINEVAALSKQVVTSSMHACESLSRFERILSEE